MGKFKKGDRIKNSSLYVIDYVSGNRVRCGCEVCNNSKLEDYVSMVYNESDLIKGGVQCRFCKEIEKAKENGLFNEREIYLELLSNNSSMDITCAKIGRRVVIDEEDLGNERFTSRYPLGVRYGELLSISYLSAIKRKDEYGVHYTIPTHLVLKCENCGYITFEDIKGLNKKKHVCPICYRLKNQMQMKSKRREEYLYKKDIEKSQSKDFKYIKSEFSKIDRNKAMQKSVKTLESKNPDFKVVDITKDGGATTYHLVCKECGSIVTCMRSNAKIEECSFCKSRVKNKEFTKVGYLYKNYIGSIFNGLRVISQDGTTCEVECIKCKKIRSNIDLYGVLGRRYYCDCARSKVSIECPNCYAPLDDISYEDIYSGRLPSCPSCGGVVDESEFLIAIESMDYGNSLRSKLELANEGISSKAVKKIRFGNKFAVDTLIVEKDSVYKGNDEKSYYRCFCKKHNVGLTLSEDEIQNYDCQYCDDTRQRIIANPDSDSIKLE